MSIDKMFSLIHKEGHIFIIIAAIITFILWSSNGFYGFLGLLITICVALFFRDPVRVTPIQQHLILAPADGVVQAIKKATPPAELGMKKKEMLRVSIFLSVFDVHVNRIPASGKITGLYYHPGKFFNASLDKASIHNERQSVKMETENGTEIAFAQIAGLIAKRIVCDLEEGLEVKSGSRFGIIRFGSRMDVYLPLNTNIQVAVGQRTVGGETIIADLEDSNKTKYKFESR